MPLKAIDERKYQAQKYISFRWLQGCGCPGGVTAATFSAVQVSWKKSPGMKFKDIGDTATVYANRGGSTK